MDVLAHIVQSAPQVAELYYVYDNQRPTWRIFERIVTTLSTLCEGDVQFAHSATAYASQSPAPDASAAAEEPSPRPTSPASPADDMSPSNPSLSRAPAGATVSPPPSSSVASAALAAEVQLEALRKAALRLLVHVLHMQAQWLGVPGVPRPAGALLFPPAQAAATEGSDDVPRARSSTAALPQSTSTAQPQPSADVSAAPPARPSSSSSGLTAATQSLPSSASLPLSPSSSSASSSTSSASDEARALVIAERLQQNAVRHSTWMSRVDQQRADAAVLSHALRLARTEKLSSAFRYLKLVHPPTAWPAEIAQFLYRNEGQLDKAQVGDLLSNSADSLLSHTEYDALRSAYLGLLDFTGMTFDAALRAFLTSSGFRLPGEAQKIDRMLVAFCRAYCADNADAFPSADAAFILAFALVMLNTDQHNANMRHRTPMTEEQFVANLRGVNNGADFPRGMLSECYASVRDREIAFIQDKPTAKARHHKTQSAAPNAAAGGHPPHSSASSTSSSSSSSASSYSAASPSAGHGGSASESGVSGAGEVARSVPRAKAERDAVSRSFLEVLTRKSLAYLKGTPPLHSSRITRLAPRALHPT